MTNEQKAEKLTKRKEIFDKIFNENDVKVCRTCGETKKLKDFHRNFNALDFSKGSCKDCASKAKRDDYLIKSKHSDQIPSNKTLQINAKKNYSNEWRGTRMIMPSLKCGKPGDYLDASDFGVLYE